MRTRTAALLCALLLTIPVLAQETTAPAKPASQPQAPAEAGHSRLHDEIIAQEEALATAERKRDHAFFEKSLADNLVYVVFNGWVFDKDKIISGLDQLEIADLKMENYKVLPLAANAVLLTYDLLMKASLDGHELPQKNYASSVWENRDGHWQLVFHQVTPARHP